MKVNLKIRIYYPSAQNKWDNIKTDVPQNAVEPVLTVITEVIFFSKYRT